MPRPDYRPRTPTRSEHRPLQAAVRTAHWCKSSPARRSGRPVADSRRTWRCSLSRRSADLAESAHRAPSARSGRSPAYVVGSVPRGLLAGGAEKPQTTAAVAPAARAAARQSGTGVACGESRASVRRSDGVPGRGPKALNRVIDTETRGASGRGSDDEGHRAPARGVGGPGVIARGIGARDQTRCIGRTRVADARVRRADRVDGGGCIGPVDPARFRGQSSYAAFFSYSRFFFSSMNFISNSIGLT